MIKIVGNMKFSDKQLSQDQLSYLHEFTTSFHVKYREGWEESSQSKYLRTVANLPVGNEGAFIVGYSNIMLPSFEEAKKKTFTMASHDITPPDYQPSNICLWVINPENPEELIWSGSDDIYKLADWITYLIDHFFIKWDINVNGSVEFSNSDDSTQCGTITVVNNSIFSSVE